MSRFGRKEIRSHLKPRSQSISRIENGRDEKDPGNKFVTVYNILNNSVADGLYIPILASNDPVNTRIVTVE